MLKGNLRPILFEDAEMVLAWRNQDFVRLNMYYHEVIDLETHMKWFASMMKDDTSLYFIYEQKNVPLGLVAFTNIDQKNNKAFWAFYAADNKKIGVGVEMETLALQYAFETLKLHKLCCEVLEFNSNVISFHQKFGFVQEGIRRQDYRRNEEYFDIYELALFRDVYTDSKKVVELKFPKRYHWNLMLDVQSLSDSNMVLNILTKNILKELSNYIECDYNIESCALAIHDIEHHSNILSGIFSLRTHVDRFLVIQVEILTSELVVLSGSINIRLK